MNRRDFNKMMLAAASGLVAGAAVPAFADHHEGKAEGGGKHDCKGQNACKGKGGCKTDANECKGHNACKGKGGCKTKEGHTCGGKNECKGKGGCKTADHACKGQNECKGKGGCATGDYAHGAHGDPAPADAPPAKGAADKKAKAKGK